MVTATQNRGAVDHEQESRSAVAWLRASAGIMSAGRDAFLSQPEARSITIALPDRRAQSVVNEVAGGYLAAGSTTIAGGLTQAMDNLSPVRRISRLFQTPSSGQCLAPLVDERAIEGAIIAENEEVPALDIIFAAKMLRSYKFSSLIVKISHELLRDAYLGFAGDLGAVLGARIGRRLNRALTTGSGAGEPWGFLPQAPVYATSLSATSFTEDNVLDLLSTLPDELRANAAVMAHSNALNTFRRSSTATRWSYDGGVERFQGIPVVSNDHMPAASAASEKILVVGDFSRLVVRQVADVRLVRLDERYAENDSIAFVAFSENDSEILNAGDAPIRALQLAAI